MHRYSFPVATKLMHNQRINLKWQNCDKLILRLESACRAIGMGGSSIRPSLSLYLIADFILALSYNDLV